MNPVDIGLIAVAVVSIAVGAWRGFAREALALAGWVAAVFLALRLARPLGERIPLGPELAGVKTAVAAVAIVVACTLVAGIAGRLVRGAMKAASLGGPDRALGALFGAARAVAIGLAVATVVTHAGLAQRAVWKGSFAAPWLGAALRFASPAFVPGTERSASATGV